MRYSLYLSSWVCYLSVDLVSMAHLVADHARSPVASMTICGPPQTYTQSLLAMTHNMAQVSLNSSVLASGLRAWPIDPRKLQSLAPMYYELA